MVNVTWVNIMNILYSGLIISGGYYSIQSLEVYIPSTGHHCTLTDLPAVRYGHTMEEMLVCGGDDQNLSGGSTQTSCLTLTDSNWETTTRPLLERR